MLMLVFTLVFAIPKTFRPVGSSVQLLFPDQLSLPGTPVYLQLPGTASDDDSEDCVLMMMMMILVVVMCEEQFVW